MHDKSAEQLMIQYQAGDYHAFVELYSRYKSKVYGFLLKKMGNPQEAQEVMQNVFLKIHSSKALYKSRFLFEQWLFVIVRSCRIDYLRKNKKVEFVEWDDNFAIDTSDTETHEELSKSLNLSSLSENEKLILQMRYQEEKSFQEIAKKIDKNEPAVRKTISRILQKLKKNQARSA